MGLTPTGFHVNGYDPGFREDNRVPCYLLEAVEVSVNENHFLASRHRGIPPHCVHGKAVLVAHCAGEHK